MGMVMYADKVETKEKLKLPEIKTNYNKSTGYLWKSTGHHWELLSVESIL